MAPEVLEAWLQAVDEQVSAGVCELVALLATDPRNVDGADAHPRR